MSPITHPLKHGDNNDQVANLKAALQLMVEKKILKTRSAKSTASLTNKQSGYDAGTAKLVAAFQKSSQLPATGLVDEATATALNQAISGISLTGVSPVIITPAPAPKEPVLITTVPPVILEPPVIAQPPIILDPPVTAQPPVTAEPPVSNPPQPVQSNVSGFIYMDYGIPANNLKLRLYAKGFAGNDTPVAEASTAAAGNYSFAYDAANLPNANLEVRAVDANGNEHPLSGTLFNMAAGNDISGLNLVAPTEVKPVADSEFSRLSKDLSSVIGDLSKLSDAQEKDDRQDITYLSQNTNWDARPIALAALATQLSTTTQLPQEAAYALVRAGLPTDADHLAQVSADDVQQALKTASGAGIVSLDDNSIAAAAGAFQAFANKTRLGTKDFGSLSTYDDLLSSQRLADNEKAAFANAFFSPRKNASELWQKAKDAGVSDATIKTLQLQGKLGMLTANNLALTQNLQAAIGDAGNLSALVDEGLYEPEAWDAKLKSLAGTDDDNADAIDKLIPPAYAGGSVADRKEAYITDMAAKVRDAFPEKVIGNRVATGKLVLGDEATQQGVSGFLNKADSLGYKLGSTHIDSFVTENSNALFNGATAEQKTTAVNGLKKLTRIHQVTPNDEAMPVLLELGHTSAQDIIAVPKDDFINRFAKQYSDRYKVIIDDGIRIGTMIYNKSQQVFTTTYSFYTAAQTMQQTPPVFAIAGAPEKQAADQQSLSDKISGAPNLQQLFGSLDFCECEHCHSVLSPAAYLVDLLQFLDRKETDWQYFLDKWQTDHAGESYEPKYAKPYDALIDRRPDIVNLPLTCENTETALPYIDVVNEILEYYVVNKKLTADVAHDTGNATTPELLAEPQNVEPAAYGILKEAVYPLNLPYDLWIETVRQFCNQYSIPLWQVIETMQPITGEDFSMRQKIAVESLRISPAEYAIYSNPNSLDSLFTLYGFEDAATMAAGLKSAKTLSQRLGITYKELYALMQTQFINPQWSGLVLLQKMSVTITDVFSYKKADGFAAFTDAERQAFEDKLSHIQTLYGTDAKAAIETAWTAGVFTQILLLNDTNAGCNFDATIVGYADRNSLSFDWLKFNLFVRLWKKIGWTMEETDAALQAFLPKNLKAIFNDPAKSENDRAAALTQAFSSALLNLAHLAQLASKVNAGKGAIIRLSTFWNDIPAIGNNSLYNQLFLSRNVLKIDAVFDDALGQYVSKDINIKAADKDHSIAVQAALNLTADDLAQILNDNGQDINTAKLSLANLSLLYRYSLLAKGLKISVAELILWKQLSGFDPFSLLSPDALQANQDDHFAQQTLLFVDTVLKIKNSGFKLDDITYLFQHRFDITGKYRNAASEAVATIQLLANEIIRIQSAYAAPANPADANDITPFAAFTDDVLQQNLSLAVSAASVQNFMAMWTGKIVADWSLVKDDVQTFLAEDQFNELFVPDAAGTDDATKQNNLLQKRSTLANSLLLFVQQKLIHQSVVQILATALASSSASIEWLISDASRLHLASQPATALTGIFAQANSLSKASLIQQAFILLSKVMQLAAGFGWSDKELQYFVLQGNDFNLAVNTIPVEENDANAQALFASFLRLTDYELLRQDIAGGDDSLTDIFTSATVLYDPGDEEAIKAQHLAALYQQVASLTRRNISTVAGVANALNIQATTQNADGKLLVTADVFANEKGISVLWKALQLVQTFGIPVQVITDAAQIINTGLPEEQYQSIADDFKNAVKARYELEAWQQIAQPVFDNLRQKRRDALVAYLLHNFSDLFGSAEEMYEYFLVDPETEPVVQTSRIRIATASVQLFIQRCLLNLENRWDKKVPPAAVNAKQWQWMNRYRVWEANRKIFLWPENWLEPEWRDDKTHLFTEMEGKLLQGDVSADLVEDVFFIYLQKMEELARLNIVTMYCEENATTPEANKLHVVGRTYGFPHTYFYRRYAQEMWTPWEPIDAEIDGDHVVAMMWRGRLMVLWVTFIEKIIANNIPSHSDDTTTKLSDWTVSNALSSVADNPHKKTIEAHLHWSEYYNGKWSAKQSGGLDTAISNTFPMTTGPGDIVITVSKEPPVSEGLDGAIHISLSGLGGFRLANKNSPPESISADTPPAWKFTAAGLYINRLSNYNNKPTVMYPKLSVSFPHLIQTLNGATQTIQSDPQTILGSTIGKFDLVPCSAPVTMGGAEFGPLISPFFYQDSWYTFYVEPSLKETITINEWDEWVGGPPVVYSPSKIDWGAIKIEPYYPWPKNVPVPKDSGDPAWINTADPRIRVAAKQRQDWTTSPNTYIQYGERVIGKEAGLNVLVAGKDSQQPVLVKNSDALNAVIRNSGTGAMQDILLLPADKTDLDINTVSAGSALIKDGIGVQASTLLVGGGGILSSGTIAISQHPSGIFSNNISFTKSFNQF